MADQITTESGSVGPGQIQFFDSIQPPLPAGAYLLEAEQKITVTGETVPPYKEVQRILVDGPRFSINGAVIHTLYPPANQTGNYSTSLPHLVFGDFALPWSRKIDFQAETGENQVPWIGLLTLYAEDYQDRFLNRSDDVAEPRVSEPKTVTAGQLVHPDDKKILGPLLPDITDRDDRKVSVIDIDLPFFQSASPLLEELRFLAHGRVVNTDGKAMLGMDKDGSFSVVVGNRVPTAASKNRVILVSYEGHQDHLRGSTIPGSYTHIRLVLLYAWEFTASAFTGSFVSLMENICRQGGGGVSLLQMPQTETRTGDALAREALDIGFVPLQNAMRIGETSTSWYRGPLVPAPTKRDFMYGPYHYSDHAMHYDPEYGLFNHAYSAAWQIGRLLALSDASFSSAFFRWRNRYLKKITQDAKRATSRKYAAMIGRMTEKQPPAAQEDSLVGATLKLLAGFTKIDMPLHATRAEKMLSDRLEGVLTDKQMRALLHKPEDPLVGLIKKIKKT